MATSDTFTLESDETGFTLLIRGAWDCSDFDGTVSVRLPYADCVQLHAELRPMREWLQEAADARATMPPSAAELQEMLDWGVYDDDPHKRIGIEREIERRRGL